MLKTGELLVERRRCPVVPNLPLARWCSRLHLDLARLGPAPPRSSRPCAFSLISALRLLAHLGHEPPRSSRPCASSLISALRLSSILQLIAEKKNVEADLFALPAAPHPSRIPRMKLRTSCMRVFSSCPRPPPSAQRWRAGSLSKNSSVESFFWTSPRAYRGVARTK